MVTLGYTSVFCDTGVNQTSWPANKWKVFPIGAVSANHVRSGLKAELFKLHFSVLFPLLSAWFRWISVPWIRYGKTVVSRIVRLLRWLRHMPLNLLLPLLHGWQKRWGGWRQLPALRSGDVRSASQHLLHGADPIQDPRAKRNWWYVLEWYLGHLLLPVVYAGSVGARSERRTWSDGNRSLVTGARSERKATEILSISPTEV